MATSKSGNKSVRQAGVKRVFNMRRLRTMKASIKQVADFVSNKDKKGAEALLPQAFKSIDKAAKRGILKKNTAARGKSKLTRDVAGVK
ncbi:MAG: 30S ribosomal protein S20 [Candidatus Pacebacteria bacterium]|nr:30S ribosomal protein S20 [Candidatus Paceibacterota bacterium]